MSTSVEENFDTESFIVEVEKRGALWNQGHEDYANKIKKKNSWEEILRIFILNFDDLTPSQKNELYSNYQRKWKSLRDSYMREKKYQKTKKSGSAAKAHKIYVFYEQLKFLEACSEPADTVDSLPEGSEAGNLDETEEDNVDGDLEELNNVRVNAVDKPTVQKKKNNKRNSTFQKTADQADALIELLKIKCMREATPKVEDDADKLFLLSLHDDLKSIPANLKLKVKCQILQVLLNAK